MKIAIIGIGAMGCLFAGRLAPLADLVMLGTWEEQINALRGRGLTIIQPDGRQMTRPVRATNDLSEVKPVELALILVKSYKTAPAAEVAAQVLRPDGLALTLQNGLGNLETLAAFVGPQRAILGVTSQGATMIGPGIVREGGPGPTYLATRPDVGERLNGVADMFQTAVLETYTVDNAVGLVWGKLAVNAGINPLTALLRVDNGFLADHALAREVMSRAAEETAAVARALGIELPFASAASRALEVARATAGNQSSMLQDVARGAPTEIEAISGQIVRLGTQNGVATPVNERLLTLVRAGRKLPAAELDMLLAS